MLSGWGGYFPLPAAPPPTKEKPDTWAKAYKARCIYRDSQITNIRSSLVDQKHSSVKNILNGNQDFYHRNSWATFCYSPIF